MPEQDHIAAGLSERMAALQRDLARCRQLELSQRANLDLLHRITRAIGERQDLHSIFGTVVTTLEERLPLDFAAIWLYDAAARTLSVSRIGRKSRQLAAQLALLESVRMPIDMQGLSHYATVEVVYEPRLLEAQSGFSRRLAEANLGALVAAPLVAQNNLFGVLLAARAQADSFSEEEREFLRRLSEHVALAAHQARLYAVLQQAYDDLRQSQQAVLQQERLRALGQMASGVAHDINNAISPISLYTESLLEQEQGLSAQARASLGVIRRSIDDVAQTVARMREFYRPRETQLALAPINLNDLVLQVIDLTRARWSAQPQARGIVISVYADLPADLPFVMGADGDIRDALINLVFNAVDAMSQGGTLTVRTHSAPGAVAQDASAEVCLEVADTGLGMDEDTRRRCLEPFFTTKGERGTGLGLAMVYGMVQRHSADLDIESAPGRGTTVRITFPAITKQVPEISPAAADAASTPLRILVIDDDPLILEAIRTTLEQDGHEVVTANSGQEGIDLFVAAHASSAPFAVVMTDLGMPYVDGRQVAAAVKTAASSVAVVMLTGWGQRLIDENDLPPHVDRVLSKPPRLRELRTVLAELGART